MTSIATTKRFDAALAILRVALGATFIAHGAQKLFVFGLAGVTGAFGQMGAPLPAFTGPATAFVELFGGLAIVFGLLTRLAGLGLAVVMVGAIGLVHLKAGFFAPQGVEFPLSLLAASTALALTGAGRWSLDALIGQRRDAQLAATREQLATQARRAA